MVSALVKKWEKGGISGWTVVSLTDIKSTRGEASVKAGRTSVLFQLCGIRKGYHYRLLQDIEYNGRECQKKNIYIYYVYV